MRRLGLSMALWLFACQGALDFGGEGDDDPTGPDAGPGSDRTLLFYYGPMKIMPAEMILYSVEAFTGHDFGSWNEATPEPGSQAFIDSGNGNGNYYRHCRILGGCLEHRIPLGRTHFVGTAYVLELERAVVEGCYDRGAFGMFPGETPPGGGTQPIDVINHQYRKAFGELPGAKDLPLSLDYFADHMAAPEFGDVSPLESAARGHCRALLTTNRFLFY